VLPAPAESTTLAKSTVRAPTVSIARTKVHLVMTQCRMLRAERSAPESGKSKWRVGGLYGLIPLCRLVFTFEGPRRVSEHSETIHLNAERLTPRAGPAARDMSSTIQLAHDFCRTTRM
jgi:hypothetical protein